MKEIITYQAYIKDLLQLKVENANIQIIKYNRDRHYQSLVNLYNEIFPDETLGLNWERVEGFYEKGIFLAKDGSNYIAFMMACVMRGKIYIAKFGTLLAYRNKNVAKSLMFEAAEHFNKLSYEKVYIEVEENEPEDFFTKLGFRKVEL